MKFRTLLVIIFCLSCSRGSAQGWPKIFWDDQTHTYVRDLQEDYDKGILLAGRVGWGAVVSKFATLQKMDINGEILWLKKFGNSGYSSYFNILSRLDDGGIILCGYTTK